MRSRQLALESYDSDKVRIGYLDIYDPVLAPWVDKKITLLELGIHKGGSLQLWYDYFPRGTIAGIDIELAKRLHARRTYSSFSGQPGRYRISI